MTHVYSNRIMATRERQEHARYVMTFCRICGHDKRVDYEVNSIDASYCLDAPDFIPAGSWQGRHKYHLAIETNELRGNT